MGKPRSRAYKRTKRFLKQLAGQDVWSSTQIKTNKQNYGNWVINPDDITSDSVIYSLGVGEDIEFDQQIIKQFGVTVHAFDPTPNSIEWINATDVSDNFIFHPYGIAATDGELKLYPRVNKRGRKSKVMYTLVNEGNANDDAVLINVKQLPTVMNELNHNHIDILKMDIEGSEFEVINEIFKKNIDIKQILVEFHHRFPTLGKEKAINAIDHLNKLGYKIFFISDTGWEYSFIKITDSTS